jgi:hypothetical protein
VFISDAKISLFQKNNGVEPLLLAIQNFNFRFFDYLFITNGVL